MKAPTVKLVDRYRRDGGRWYLDPTDRAGLNYVKRVLAETQTAEPDADWHLETRGTVADWHRWKE